MKKSSFRSSGPFVKQASAHRPSGRNISAICFSESFGKVCNALSRGNMKNSAKLRALFPKSANTLSHRFRRSNIAADHRDGSSGRSDLFDGARSVCILIQPASAQ